MSVAGWRSCSTHARIGLSVLTPGEYGYADGPIPGYTEADSSHGAPLPRQGTVNLTHALIVHLRFSQVTYVLSFTETGLAAGSRWVVRLHGLLNGHRAAWSRSSRNGTVVFLVPNGTLNYSVRPVRGYAGPPSGSVVSDGATRSVSVAFVGEPPRASSGLPAPKAAGAASGSGWRTPSATVPRRSSAEATLARLLAPFG